MSKRGLKKFDYRSHYERDADRVNMLTGISPWRQYRDSRRFQVILDSFPRKANLSVLDVGCGDGAFLKLCGDRGFEVTGLEVSEKRVARAQKFLRSKSIRADVLAGDINKLPFEDRAFDVVVASEVVEHVVDPERAVSELARVTKEGGKVIITVPYKEKPTFDQCIHCGKLTPKAGHLHSFDIPKSKKLMASAGLRNIDYRLCVPQRTPFWKVGRRLPYFIWRHSDRLFTYLGDKLTLTPLMANWILVRGER